MKINPSPTKFIIFSGGGGLIERVQKIHLVPGINRFEIENVPAAFDPSTTSVFFPNPSNDVILVQVDVKRPDKKIVENFINKEKTAATAIIQNSTDLRGTNRDIVNQVIESAYYRCYEDMPGIIIVSLESKIDVEIGIGIKYFLEDARIKWEPSLHIKIDEKTNTATIEGFILAMNNTDMTYPTCDIAFAEFEMEKKVTEKGFLEDLEMEQAAQNEMPKNRMVQNFKKVKHYLV